MNIYVASSWRNVFQPRVVQLLRELGHIVYDFRNPTGRTWFSWTQLGEPQRPWTPAVYRERLQHPVAQAGFRSDMDALEKADTCILVMPSGASAHLELGYSIGANKTTAVYYPDGIGEFEPELMALAADFILVGEQELIKWVTLSPLMTLDGKSCMNCLHRCVDMDLDPYCSKVNEPYGKTLSRGKPAECGAESRLWALDTRK